MIVYVKFSFNGKSSTVALAPGLEPNELKLLLKTIFNLPSPKLIVGALGENDVVVPISVLCKSPSLIGKAHCQLIVANSFNSSNSSNSTLDSKIEQVFSNIRSFANELFSRGFLTDAQNKIIDTMLVNNSPLLFAAYSVAVSAQDSEYLAEIFRNLARLMTTEEGRLVCEAQEDLLEICDELYGAGKIIENQLLYLRHLILIREEVVVNAYDEYQSTNNVKQLAEALTNIAYTHPLGDNNDNTDKDSKKEETKTTQEDDDSLTMDQVSEGLMKIVSVMIKNKLITENEVDVLLELIALEDDVVIAAYELYLKNNQLNELQDTLLRCVRLEIRRRLGGDSSKSSPTAASSAASSATSSATSSASDSSSSDSNYHEKVKNFASLFTSPQSVQQLRSGNMDKLAEVLGIQVKQLEPHVPQDFLNLLIFAFFQGEEIFSQTEIFTLIKYYLQKNELVLSAWEVFNVQHDVADLFDTLKRILPKQNATPAAASAAPASPSSNKTTASATTSPSKAATSESLEARRAQALEAVNKAKKELLTHTLDMMIKQNLLTKSQADILIKKYSEGDNFLDNTIETYSSNKNIVEFLTNLTKYASQNSTEEATEEDAEGEENAEETQSDEDSDDAAFTQIAEIIREMLNSGVISPQIADVFVELINAKDSRILNAYKNYLSGGEGNVLVDSLLRIVRDTISEKLGEARKQLNLERDEESERDEVNTKKEKIPDEDEDDDEEDEEEEGEEDEGEEDSFDRRFEAIMKKMNLSELESAALKLAIAENHPSVRAGLIEYSQHNNEQSLFNHFRKAIKEVIDTTLSQDFQNNDEEEEEEEQEEEEQEDQEEDEQEDQEEDEENQENENNSEQDEDDVDAEAQDYDYSKYNEEDEEEDDQIEEEEEDEDDEEEEGELTTHDKWAVIFPELLNELSSNNLITKAQNKNLMQQFQNKDKKILQVIENYEGNGSMQELVSAFLSMV